LRAVDYAVIAVITFLMGVSLGAWRMHPIPPGNDALSHMAKIRFVSTYWPHIRWNHLWGSGMPLFRWYPPLFYIITSVVAKAFHVATTEAVVVIMGASFWLVGVGIYAFIRELTDDRGLSLLATTMALATPSLWKLYTIIGLFARVPSAAFYALSLFAAMRAVKRKTTSDVVLTSLFVALSTLFHPSFGALALVSVCLLCVFLGEGVGGKAKMLFKIVLLTFLCSAWFVIPFVSPLPPNPLVLKTPLERFVNPIIKFSSDAQGTYPNPIILPLTVVLLLASAVGKVQLEMKRKVILWSFVTLFLIYSFSTQKLDPESATIGLTFCLIPASTYLLKGLCKSNRKSLAVVVVSLMAFSVVFHIATSPGGLGSFNRKFIGLFGNRYDPFSSVKSGLSIPESDYRYRAGVAGLYEYAGQWFNYVYDVPQTREYYGQGLTRPEFYGLYSLVYYESDEYNKTNFLLDWWGIKWILARDDMYIEGTDMTHHEKFLERPDLYELTGRFEHYYEFTYRNATPIVVASNAVSLLVIGDENAYSDAFTALMYSNSNSLYVVVIRGSRYIDDYDVDDLLEYDVVLIRGYRWHDRVRAWSILMEYVMNGGNLVIETGYSPDSSSTFIPAPCPVESTHASGFGSTWNLTYVRNEITEGIRFDLFSPPLYGESPWGMSYSDNESVRDWATPILYEEGYPVIAVGEYGGGRVVWCGMNLPYHVCCYRNYWESLLWFRLIAWASGRSEFGMVSYDFERPNPEKVVVHVHEPARGILFKEYMFKNWRAVLVDGAGRKFRLTIHEAGPGFMYVTIPDGVQYPVDVTFKYDLSWDELLGYALSIPTYLWAAVYLVRGLRRREGGGGDGGVR